jgi:hypothetical protein
VLSKVFLSLDGALTPEEEKEFLEEINKCSCCLDAFNIEKAFKEFLCRKIARKEVKAQLVIDIKTKIKQISVE